MGDSTEGGSGELRAARPSVFLEDFVDVGAPRDALVRRLVGEAGLLGRLAGAAGEDACSELVRIGPSSLGEWVAREVRVRLGPPMTRDGSVVVALRWEDARHPLLFPVLDGNLEVVSLGPERSRIVLYASYRPPFEGVGRLLDRALLHRVAESSLRSFLMKLAGVLEAPPGDGGEAAGGPS